MIALEPGGRDPSPSLQADASSPGAGTDVPAGGSREGRLRELIREIPDFPSPGIGFKDITPLLADADALADAVRALAEYARPLQVDCVVAAEARGFLLGPALAMQLGAGFALARKPGKLPYETVSAEYVLEYGAGELELHTDAVERGTRVLIHDDLLATGGTAKALCELVEELGGEVAGCGFLVELAFLNGRKRLAPHGIHSLLTYES
jgi:adenine phosphoribosyltransferase